MSSMDFKILSARESKVVGLAARGLIDKEIAQSIRISPNTLRTYWRRIREKLGEHTRARITAEYVAAGGLFPVDSEMIWRPRAGSSMAVSEWHTDMRTGMQMASDQINLAIGLEVGVPHPMHLYSGAIPPTDQRTVMEVFESAVRSMEPTFTATHRGLMGGRMRSFHTFAELTYERDTVVEVRGHTVALDVPELLSTVTVGMWTYRGNENLIEADDHCFDILGIQPESPFPLTRLESLVEQQDRASLRQLFEEFASNPAARASGAFAVARADSAVVHLRVHGKATDEPKMAVGSFIAAI